MIELRRAIELRNGRGQFDPETPFIGAASHLIDRCAPSVPPARHEPGNRLDDFALMAKGDAVAGGESASFEQRVFHPGDLLLHCFKRLADYRRPHFSCAEITNFFYLQEIEKGIALSSGDQFGFFPSSQLARRDPKDAKQIRSTVSVHGNIGALLSLSASMRRGGNRKVVASGTFVSNFAASAVQEKWKSSEKLIHSGSCGGCAGKGVHAQS